MKRSVLLISTTILFAFILSWNASPSVGIKSNKKKDEAAGDRSSSEKARQVILQNLARGSDDRRAGVTTTSNSRESRFAEETGEGVDPDAPGILQGRIPEAEYLRRRAGHIARLRGIEPGKPFDIQRRIAAVKQRRTQEVERFRNRSNELLSREGTLDWVPIGPAPIPNGQTQTTVTAVSGRVTAIDVHPTNPSIAYVGTAQGGLYRTLDGGATWTQLMNSPPPPGSGFSPAGTLAIGAVAIDPVNPTTVFVGTGEGNLSLDSFFGEGIYRIINAQTTPTVQGPFETRTNGGGGHAFAGTAITKIIIDPANDNNMFVGNNLGASGKSGDNFCCGNVNPISAFIGLYFSSNAQAATPTWVRVNPASLPGGGFAGVSDIAIDPTDANVLVLAQEDFLAAGNSGIFSSTNALSGASSTFTRPVNFTNSLFTVELASYKPVGSPAVFYAATEETNGRLRRSTDGGATFSAAGVPPGGNGFCGGQCFYDIAIAVDPGPTTAITDDIIYLGGNVRGASTKLMARSDNGGATFSDIDNGLHADNHAITIAPSNKNIVYNGNDGGVWRSDNAKDTPANVVWTDVNTATFSATQFMSLAVHPTDPNFTIGGTQDNGTPCFGNCNGNTPATWIRTDFGDGGFSAIDQNATDTTNVTMYHTYFNATGSLIGFARVNTTACARDNQWSFKGRYTGAVDPTIHCDGTTDTFNGISLTDSVNFYAPIALGPGNPNTVYFGSDRLYRSTNKGDSMTVVSQAPLVANVPISAIAISPQDDNFRIVGLNNGGLFFTTTGSSILTSLDAVGAGSTIPDQFVGRIAFDPTNKNTAYIALNGYTGSGAGLPSNHVWKITNLSTTPVITSINGSGTFFLPDIPVNSIVVDPLNPMRLLAGTDIGVYISVDDGGTWAPFGTGFPPIAVFDMAVTSNHLLRIATHGLGMWQIQLPMPTAAPASISGTITSSNGSPIPGVTMRLAGAVSATTITDSAGAYRFEGVDTDNFYTVTPSLANYHFSPANRSFSLLGSKSDAVFTGTPDAIFVTNAIDSSEYFVRQQYLDFLDREPDQGGLNYWSNQINGCGTDRNCIRDRRLDVSAAFFVEQEFQQTGSFVYRLYKSALGRQLSYAEYSADRQQVIAGPNLDANKQALTEAFVGRAEFVQRYQSNTTAASFVDALLQTVASVGTDLSSERNNLIAAYNGGNSINESRALTVRAVAENPLLSQAVYNQAFVLVQYFSYLRRDPDRGGYDFWLNVLNNREPGNYRGMVCAFLTSTEYQRRFGTVITRSNSDCGP